MSSITCQVSCVTCLMSPVICRMSVTPTATAMDPPTANSPSMHSRMLLLNWIGGQFSESEEKMYLKKRKTYLGTKFRIFCIEGKLKEEEKLFLSKKYSTP